MNVPGQEIKELARSILEDKGSQFLLDRVEKMIEAAGENHSDLVQAVKRVEKIVKLFVGADEANLIAERAMSILEKKPE